MEISEHDLRRLVAEADEHHRAGMGRLEADLTELHLGEGREPSPTSRRHLLQRVAAGGAAIAIGATVVPMLDLVRPAAAQTADETPTDADLVAFGESLELALAAAYAQAATAAAAGTGAVKSALITFAGHHQQHASAFATVGTKLSAKSTHKPNPKLLDVAHGQFAAARDADQVLDVGFLLETAAASTYMVALETLKNTDAMKLAASVLPVESQHAVAFGAARGKAITDLVPTFVLPDHALDTSKYPLAT